LVFLAFLSNGFADFLSDFPDFGIEKKIVEKDDSSEKDDSPEKKDLPDEMTFCSEWSPINTFTIITITFKNQNILSAILSRATDINTPPPESASFI
jgi:hypothetical protein